MSAPSAGLQALHPLWARGDVAPKVAPPPLIRGSVKQRFQSVSGCVLSPPHRTDKPSALTPLCGWGVARSRESERLRGHAGRCPSNGRSHGCKPRERGTSHTIRVGVEMTLQIHGQVVPSAYSRIARLHSIGTGQGCRGTWSVLSMTEDLDVVLACEFPLARTVCPKFD